jgi:26S proteasome regulatory subunit N13
MLPLQKYKSKFAIFTFTGMDEDTEEGDQPMAMTGELPQDPNATPATDSNPRSANPGTIGGGAGSSGGIFEAGGIGASQLAAALGNILSGAAPSTNNNPNNNNVAAALRMGPPLGEVLKAERIAPLLTNNATLVERLAPYLPEEHRTPEAMAEIVNSPQFKHQLDVLTQALAQGQISTSEFGLGASPAYGVAEFLKAIQREAEKEKKESEGSQEEKKEGGEGGSS